MIHSLINRQFALKVLLLQLLHCNHFLTTTSTLHHTQNFLRELQPAAAIFEAATTSPGYMVICISTLCHHTVISKMQEV